MSDMFTTAAAPAPTSAGGMAPDAAKAAIQAFEVSSAWRDVLSGKDDVAKAHLMQQRAALYAAAYPEPATTDRTHRGPGWSVDADVAAAMEAAGPPDEVWRGAADAAWAPATETEIRDRLNTADLAGSAEDREAFMDLASRALTFADAPAKDAAWLALAAQEVAKEPGKFTREYAESELRADFGHDYDRGIAAARQALARIEKQVPGITAHLDETGLGNHPHVVSLLWNAARRFGYIR